MNMASPRIIVVDWSGDRTISNQRKKIWIADWSENNVSLTSGRTRDETAEYLVAAAVDTPNLIAGLDFAFSFPAWFVRMQGCERAEEFWALVANGKGEEWLSQANAFCWGRKGSRRPDHHRAPAWQGFRQTDRKFNGQLNGIQPKSPFQIGGAGAVGTGSLRGIPILRELRRAGFSIWPFTATGFPVALEIYPRLFTGPGNKSSEAFRIAHLRRPEYTFLPEDVLAHARGSEDAFDALCSVLGMREHARDFASLHQATDPVRLLEGEIWTPHMI
ncbi:putative molybdopterin biosynthesis related methylmutase domain / Molybdopterin biosynthesis protein MoeA [Acidisarcina polymorpha]|uniref:Putative molybdopterin biosynthesis related methylmutase domain / Molybdopterin biosynthesis protein MoeA n=1 Tax=Acidisarcina polymorpha TaxID=2211140 RepID=A0A2Z5G411_9BACT|nr:hypothetical protein [Acidisarcina polymorpha]AXC13385.1 putative molybdopterin biosynthesis related methylmutase domain / Molybdopterin biosynthesis protein MoeA [Acidisarcina polymorpha]